MTNKWIFGILKMEMLKTSFSVVQRIGQRSVIKGTLNRKADPNSPRAFTIKYNHILKMTVLKGVRKHLLSTSQIQNGKRNFF